MKDTNITNSPKIQERELESLKQLFPQFFSEWNFDSESFKNYLDWLTTDNNEFYRFEWTGKKNAKQIASKPTKNTLLPDRENSKNWETTENMIIEWDNLEVLKLLLNKYYGQIKMIYIDPPYNKDKDFVYKDTWKDNLEDYLAQTWQVDENGETTTEKETTWRKHSNWLNMIYPRLILARKLLKEDGVIFVSIDDDEVHNLRKIMDEVFGEDNFINNFMWLHWKWKKDKNSRTLEQYILCYAKNKDFLESWSILKEKKYTFSNPDNDIKGDWFSWSISFSEDRSNKKHKNFYKITSPSWIQWERQWQISEEEMKELIDQWDIYFGYNPYFNNVPRLKVRPWNIDSIIPENIISWISSQRDATNEVSWFFWWKVLFDNPKPVDLINYFLSFSVWNNDIILDFFSGSWTTAHAVMELNKEDWWNRKFICVQLPEKVAKNSEAEKAGYKTISEITRARIDKAWEKIKNELKDSETSSEWQNGLDIWFRAFTLAESNFAYLTEKYEIKTWLSEEENQKQMQFLEENMKKEVEETGLIDGRNEIDVIYELIIREWYSFYSQIEKLENNEKQEIWIYKISDENKYFYALIKEKLTNLQVRDFVKNHLEEKVVRFFALEESLESSERATLETYFSLENI